MNKLIKYFRTALGIDLFIVPCDPAELRKYPAYLHELYQFYQGELLDQPILMVEYRDQDPLSPGQYRKHQILFDQIVKLPVVFVFHSLPSYHRNRLSSMGVNYIIPNTQIFMPFLMILSDKISCLYNIPDSISPSAQELLLYYFLHDGNELSYEVLEKCTGMPYPTVCRAVDNLRKASLCEVVGTRKKIIYFEEDKNALLKQALHLMKSPVTRTVFAEEVPEGAVVAGRSALSFYSKSKQDDFHHVAISRQDYKRLKEFSYDESYLPVHIQVWRYNPNTFARDGMVDRISLFLSMKDDLSDANRALFDSINLLER